MLPTIGIPPLQKILKVVILLFPGVYTTAYRVFSSTANIHTTKIQQGKFLQIIHLFYYLKENFLLYMYFHIVNFHKFSTHPKISIVQKLPNVRYTTFALSCSSSMYSSRGTSGLFCLHETGCNGHVAVHGYCKTLCLQSRTQRFEAKCGKLLCMVKRGKQCSTVTRYTS